MSTITDMDIQHLRIKVSENAKHEVQVEVSATSVTGDKFILKEDRTDIEKITFETQLEKMVVDKFYATHKLLKEGNKTEV
tara:strand:- start:1475 stop:1714 length:240 start_codon:yes stop_codon:yes gene_type:complete